MCSVYKGRGQRLICGITLSYLLYMDSGAQTQVARPVLYLLSHLASLAIS